MKKYAIAMQPVDIGYTTFSAPLSAEAFHARLHEVPPGLRERILSFRRWQDAHACLFGRLLLKALAAMHGKQADDLRYNAYGRPYSDAGYDFNISHAAGIVVCALARDARVGVDVEAIRPVRIADFNAVFSPAAHAAIMNAAEPLHAFYHQWTQKEAVIKANGKGMSLPLTQLDVGAGGELVLEGTRWYVQELLLGAGYKCHLATDRPAAAVRLHRM